MFKENLNRNIYYSKETRVAENFIAKERKGGRDTESFASDPLFMDMPRGDFSFKEDSPALELDIQPITMSILQEIGCSWDPWLPGALEIPGFPMLTQ